MIDPAPYHTVALKASIDLFGARDLWRAVSIVPSPARWAGGVLVSRRRRCSAQAKQRCRSTTPAHRNVHYCLGARASVRAMAFHATASRHASAFA